MRALIDGDIVAYRCAATAEGLSEAIAIARTNDMYEQILSGVKAESHKGYLTGQGNFRKSLFPEYKANRTQPKPEHLQACRQYLIDFWKCKVVDGIEADDALGIEQVFYNDNGSYQDYDYGFSIICSIDKDLLQIPGKHFNFVKQEVQEVTYMRGLREFYTQMLVGDRSDNIKGVAGIGPVKARNMLEGYETELEMFDAVRAAYNNDEQFFLNGKLLWIFRKENDIWNPSHLRDDIEPEAEIKSNSTQSPQEESIQSTEHG